MSLPNLTYNLHFAFIHNPQLAFPVPGIDGAQRVMGQQAVFHHQRGDRAVAVGGKDGVVSHAETADDKQLHALFF